MSSVKKYRKMFFVLLRAWDKEEILCLFSVSAYFFDDVKEFIGEVFFLMLEPSLICVSARKNPKI